MEIGWAEYGSKVTEIQGKVSESRVASQYLSWEQWLGVADSWRASGRVPAIVTGVPGSGGVRGLGGGQGAGGHGTAGAQNPVPSHFPRIIFSRDLAHVPMCMLKAREHSVQGLYMVFF